jgi:hypothetical protein
VGGESETTVAELGAVRAVVRGGRGVTAVPSDGLLRVVAAEGLC